MLQGVHFTTVLQLLTNCLKLKKIYDIIVLITILLASGARYLNVICSLQNSSIKVANFFIYIVDELEIAKADGKSVIFLGFGVFSLEAAT